MYGETPRVVFHTPFVFHVQSRVYYTLSRYAIYAFNGPSRFFWKFTPGVLANQVSCYKLLRKHRVVLTINSINIKTLQVIIVKYIKLLALKCNLNYSQHDSLFTPNVKRSAKINLLSLLFL